MGTFGFDVLTNTADEPVEVVDISLNEGESMRLEGWAFVPLASQNVRNGQGWEEPADAVEILAPRTSYHLILGMALVDGGLGHANGVSVSYEHLGSSYSVTTVMEPWLERGNDCVDADLE